MMSKKYSKRKIAAVNVTDWVEPSFSDFCKDTILSSDILHKKPSTDTKHSRKKKECCSPIESCKTERKKRKPLSIDEQYKYKLSKQNHSQNESWVDKYKPKTQNELAIHKKKIEEVEAWLKDHTSQRPPRQEGSILLLTGPPGCGKSATVGILAKDLGIQVQEWINPVSLDFKKDDVIDSLSHESDFQILPYQSQTALFQEFLLRANKYASLQMVGQSMETDRRLILVEDMPNHFYRDHSCLHEILRKFVRTSRCPLVFIISDAFSGASNQRSLFPKEIQEELHIANISFNPVAPTMMMKVLNRIAGAEFKTNGEKTDVPDISSLELICKGCSGDIRSAINNLQFSSLRGCSSENNFLSQKKGNSTLKYDTLSKVKKKKKFGNQELQAVGAKDSSIFLFHALGKILYCKTVVCVIFTGEPATDLEFPRLPVHLTEYERNPLLVHPEARPTLREYSASIATRGVMHSNRSRASAQSKGGMGFRPLHKPQWFLINKKFQENCIAAKSLFSSFCLPPVCLQTQLLPYLAMLTNPMRNPAQITFIQDIGRLPLKKHFGRLKLETLTDKDSAIQVLDSDDEGDFAEMHSTNVVTQMEKNKTSEKNEPYESPLPSSQSSGNELPASQPQPIVAQLIMEEDELIIEEYDSD
uniref:cell cycle checkpoint protein RAD17 isoform X4 n=1 Tax=Podarcis muralis TaxID=64176 RepID=UPI0010A0AF4F|nr:cell cycle checkpoint protein RAD17 isoform X4 [Podarcis muralis]